MADMPHPDIGEVLFSEAEMLNRIAAIGAAVTRDYAGKELTVVAILNGSLLFAADLLRRVNLPLQVDAWSVSSYHGTESSGTIRFRQSQLADLHGRHVLIVDDILDTGLTLKAVRAHVESQGPLSTKLCVMLKKIRATAPATEADYVGFEIPDKFVVGYGLDYNENYRNLPYIGVLTGEAIARGRTA